MAFEIEQFRQTLQAGARPNLFEVLISGAEKDLSALVTAASLPGRTIGTASAFYRGRELKLAGDMTFAPWTMTVINDESMQMRDYLERWMNDYIEDLTEKTPESNPQGVPSAYYGQIAINQLGKDGVILRTYSLIGAWPSDISDVPLSYDANDQISSFTCTWQYQHFTVSGIGGEQGSDAPSSDSQSFPPF